MPPLRARLRPPARVAQRSANLACSGSRAADVASGGDGRYGEGSQAQRLGALAREAGSPPSCCRSAGTTTRRSCPPVSPASARSSIRGARVPRHRRPAVAGTTRGDGAEGRGGDRRRPRGDAPGRLRRHRLHARAGLVRLTVHRTHDRRARRPGLPVQPRRRRVGAHGRVPAAVRDAARGGAGERGAFPGPVARDRGTRVVQPGARRRRVAAPADRRPERPGVRRARRDRRAPGAGVVPPLGGRARGAGALRRRVPARRRGAGGVPGGGGRAAARDGEHSRGAPPSAA